MGGGEEKRKRKEKRRTQLMLAPQECFLIHLEEECTFRVNKDSLDIVDVVAVTPLPTFVVDVDVDVIVASCQRQVATCSLCAPCQNW